MPSCPECNAPMVARTNNHTNERFWGCSSFPRCQYSQSFTEKDYAAQSNKKYQREAASVTDYSNPIDDLGAAHYFEEYGVYPPGYN